MFSVSWEYTGGVLIISSSQVRTLSHWQFDCVALMHKLRSCKSAEDVFWVSTGTGLSSEWKEVKLGGDPATRVTDYVKSKLALIKAIVIFAKSLFHPNGSSILQRVKTIILIHEYTGFEFLTIGILPAMLLSVLQFRKFSSHAMQN